MAVEPVGPLMFRIGLPIVLSMILQAAYNVVDSAYLARMPVGGEDALTALSLAFPVQLFMVAVSIGTGVGTNALLAKLLGLGDRENANRTAGNAQMLGIVISVIFMLFSLLGVRPYVSSQSAGGSISSVVLENAIGLPAIISQALLTVMTYSLNLILGAMPQVGQNAVTVYGLYYKIQQLIIFAAFGVRDAITPVVSFNYGARNPDRVRQVLFVLPPVWLLTRTVTGAADVSRVWWPLALGEAATLVVALIMFRSVYRKKVCDLH